MRDGLLVKLFQEAFGNLQEFVSCTLELTKHAPYLLHNRIQTSDQRARIQTDVTEILQDNRWSVPERSHFFKVVHGHEESDLRGAHVACFMTLALLR